LTLCWSQGLGQLFMEPFSTLTHAAFLARFCWIVYAFLWNLESIAKRVVTVILGFITELNYIVFLLTLMVILVLGHN